MKTLEEKIAISKQAAEIVGRAAYRIIHAYDEVEESFTDTELWLVDDHGACAEIAADRKRRISTIQYQDIFAIAGYFNSNQDYCKIHALVADFPSRIEATSWAICEAVIEQAKQS